MKFAIEYLGYLFLYGGMMTFLLSGMIFFVLYEKFNILLDSGFYFYFALIPIISAFFGVFILSHKSRDEDKDKEIAE